LFRERGIEIKTPAQIEKMRVAGLVVGETLELLRASVRAGMTTLELDRIAEAPVA
jgi:methionyl aminopeptidase